MAVNQISQTIAFAPPANATFAPGLTINLSATGGSSGNPTLFTVVSGPGAVSGTVLTVTGAGSIVVRAGQTGSGDYLTATTVDQTFVINRAAQTIAFAPHWPAM